MRSKIILAPPVVADAYGNYSMTPYAHSDVVVPAAWHYGARRWT